jgi:hypothetical protein
MSLQIHNWENFERTKLWYIIFAIVIISVIVLSIIKKNIVWTVVLFFILWAYFYYSIISNQIIKIKITEKNLVLDKKNYSRNDFVGYVLEQESKTQKIKNIVLVWNKSHTIYTINDNEDNIDQFTSELDNYIPRLREFNQTFLEKLSRILKL